MNSPKHTRREALKTGIAILAGAGLIPDINAQTTRKKRVIVAGGGRIVAG